MLKHPTKIKVVQVQSTNVVICSFFDNEKTILSANDFVRGVDDGTYEPVNFVEPPVQFDLYETELASWHVEELELPELTYKAEPIELFEMAELMA
jgi:hypothetical protein